MDCEIQAANQEVVAESELGWSRAAMNPSVLASQLTRSVGDYLRLSFRSTTPVFEGLLDRFLQQPGNLTKGPYLSIKLPFQIGSGRAHFFPQVPLPFAPFKHQEMAFKRIGVEGKSTLIATGTGSGKTECFLMPILDHCQQQGGRRGIKAILIYPMNALASDQAKRLAKMIYETPSLKGRVTAGLYVGDKEQKPCTFMDADHIVTDKEILRGNPPDILLTNYKMLDFLLIRAKDGRLWQHNDPETLKYLVVDELHTFDGAQGTDLACLIRRLKSRLDTPRQHLACVGTSATLGGPDAAVDLIQYATNVFDEPFDDSSLITEYRLALGDYLAESPVEYVGFPGPEELAALVADNYPGEQEYSLAQARLWFGDFEEEGSELWRVELASRLRRHYLFQNLLRLLKGRVSSWVDLLAEISKMLPGEAGRDASYIDNLLASLVTLVSTARIAEEGGENPRLRPFLDVRVQVWLRELRRMVVMLPVGDGEPELLYSDDGGCPEGRLALPVVHCRDCGAMGWLTQRASDQRFVNADLDVIYRDFFGNSPKSTMFFPMAGLDVSPGLTRAHEWRLCARCGELNSSDGLRCDSCGADDLIQVYEPDNRRVRKDAATGNSYRVSHKDCPFCRSKKSLLVLGARATSISAAMVGQLNSSRFNSDKQLIAFSDAVQDTAHRAGFISARVRSFNFRTALKRVIDDSGDPLSLARLCSRFNEYWLENLGEANFVGTFIPNDMEWLRDYAALVREGRLPEDSTLVDLLGLRLGWEVTAEFGIRSRIGRSLDRSGAATAFFDPAKFESSVAELESVLREEIGELRDLGKDQLVRFVGGMLAHLCIQGGVHHEGLDEYIQENGKTWVISELGVRRAYMPNMRNRPPRFLASERTGEFDTLDGWYQEWLIKAVFSAEDFQLSGDITAAVYDIVLDRLSKHGLLELRETKSGAQVWGVLQEALHISTQAVHLVCNHCHHSHTIAAQDRQTWDGMPCLRRTCAGIYETDLEGDRALDLYGRLYRDGDIGRVVAAEHTGLLSRDERALVEASFKREAADRKPWDVNLLSATPTLEMGVDIGDLSSVLLCSVPPAQANYLQRVGRAGRRDGNALSVTVVNGIAHDLYFYADPMEMMAGDVQTPGVFLDASAVLERQYTAYCLDNWVRDKGKQAVIPAKLSAVLSVYSSSEKNIAKFPYNFLNYVETHRTVLIDGFLAMFSNSHGRGLSEFSVSWIRGFAEGDQSKQGSLSFTIGERIQQQFNEVQSLKKEVKRVNTLASRLRNTAVLSPEDSELLVEYERETKALQHLVTRIGSKDMLQFLTDEGLIPNYAFPEQGVLLRSVIYRSGKDNATASGDAGVTGESERWVYEYERPAAVALSEFAPLNTFYAGGRRVEISRIDMRASSQEWWRLCRSCHHSERIDAGDHYKSCPRCGDALWSDPSQKKTMLRLKQVYANTADRASRIQDDKDDRDSQFFTRQLLVDFEPTAITAAWRLDKDSWPFGFEFISRAEFREFNSGHRDENAPDVTIAGRDEKRKGFKICRHCGLVQGALSNRQTGNGVQQHTISCAARNRDNPDNLLEGIYLYREFHSEAIRILLPVTEGVEATVVENSFVAALHLGLKSKFGGSIDHLHVAQSVEPDPDTGIEKRYLVIYDAVPGGTGYLKQLMSNKQALVDVLVEHALPVLESCSCSQIEGADGCYRCLYMYRNSRDMDTISRQKAREFIHIVRENADKIEPVDSLRNISLSPLVESELEARFIEALKRSGSDNPDFELRPEFQGTAAGWYMRYGDDYRYFIVPQVNLGDADGVAVPSRADFVIYPLGQPGLLPVVIFTDGFQYHKDRLEQDTAQRLALKASGNYLVWSLTWDDIQQVLDGSESLCSDLLAGMPQDRAEAFLGPYECQELLPIGLAGSFSMLIRYLGAPELQMWQRYSSAVVLAWFLKWKDDPSAQTSFDQVTVPEIANSLTDSLGKHPEQLVVSGNTLIGLDGQRVRTCISVDKAGVQVGELLNVGLALIFDDDGDANGDFKSSWRSFLRLINLFQFQPQGSFFSTSGIEGNTYTSIVSVATLSETEADEGNLWMQLLADALPDERTTIRELQALGAEMPELGYELVGDNGEVIAEAFLAWPGAAVVIPYSAEPEQVQEFETRGWTVISADELGMAPGV